MVNLKCEDEEEDDEEEDQDEDQEGDEEGEGDEDKEDLRWCEEGRPVSECLRH